MSRPNKYGGRPVVTSISLPDYFVDWLDKEAKERKVTKSGLLISCVLAGYDNKEEVARMIDRLNSQIKDNKVMNSDNSFIQELVTATIDRYFEVSGVVERFKYDTVIKFNNKKPILPYTDFVYEAIESTLIKNAKDIELKSYRGYINSKIKEKLESITFAIKLDDPKKEKEGAEKNEQGILG